MPTHDIPLNPYGSTAGREHMSGEVPRPKTLTVDLHNHYRVDAAANLVKPHLPTNDHPADRASELTQKIRAAHAVNRAKHMRDLDQRLADMEAMKLDVMAISCTPQQFYYVLEPSLGAESSHIVNDAIAAAVKAHPTRFTGIGTVPLQDTDLAIKELDRCVNDLGFGSVQIGCRVRNEELSAERLEPFWARCQEHDILVFLHPSSFESPRLRQHYQTNIVGNPLDTTVAVHYLIFDGVMARYPKLKVYLSHGGAFAAAYSARMDHAYAAREDCRVKIYEKPSTYMKRFYFDTIVFSVDQLEYLIKKWGADHIALGTDYPADMIEADPVEHVYQVPGLSEADREKICGLNALKLLNLDASRFRS
jgi:aminocarboxymuconate-semialdehyde decarboxylase